MPPPPAATLSDATACLRRACGMGRTAANVSDAWLVLCVDTLVEGTHFFAGTDAADLGHKALAVNLSDLAAMGAPPLTAAVVLAQPRPDPGWAGRFGAGLAALAAAWDTAVSHARVVAGPLALTVEVTGAVPRGAVLRRAGARPGDGIYVTGTLGDAAVAVAAREGRITLPPDHLAAVTARLHRPTPRLAVGQALGPVASAAIDLSDGLWGDLGHILEASGVGATVDVTRLPLGAALRALPETAGRRHALTGGDDYELCFTVPPHRQAAIAAIAKDCGVDITRIGQIDRAPGLRLVPPNAAGDAALAGYRHFG